MLLTTLVGLYKQTNSPDPYSSRYEQLCRSLTGDERPETGALKLPGPKVSDVPAKEQVTEVDRNESYSVDKDDVDDGLFLRISRIWTHAPSPMLRRADGATFQDARSSTAIGHHTATLTALEKDFLRVRIDWSLHHPRFSMHIINVRLSCFPWPLLRGVSFSRQCWVLSWLCDALPEYMWLSILVGAQQIQPVDLVVHLES